MRYPWLETRDIEVAARGLLTKVFGSPASRAPLIDLDAVVYDHLCETERLSFDDESDLGWQDGEQVLGRMYPLAGKIQITAGLKLASEVGRYRFTLAHEIGHWVLHRPLFLADAATLDLFGTLPGETELASLNRGVFPDGALSSQATEEWQANRFAVELLIDPGTLRVEFLKRFGAPVIARCAPGSRTQSRTLREHSRSLSRAEASGGPPLYSVFGLSVEAMSIALESRGYSVEDHPLL